VAWTNSKVFSAFLTDVLNNTTAMDLNADTINAALFDNSVTPDQTAASASTAYGAGVWNAGHITDTGSSAPAGWPTVGRPLGSPATTFSSNVVKFDASDTASANAVTTLAGTYGCLVYSDTIASPVADQGICFNYFGGTQSVTLGTFTIVWDAAGIFAITA
jgi:hypothetical protein